ncbi:MAG: endopeptidase La [Bacteroidales bacterium]|nr:endopeptidase La [Bacteroidales bacterium]
MRDNDKEFFAPQGAEVSIIPVMQGEPLPKIDDKDLPVALPILALRNAVLFPGSIYPVTIGREKSMKLIEDAEKHDILIGTVPQNDLSVEDPQIGDLFPYGTVTKVMKTLEMPDGTITAILQGIRRFHLDEIIEYEPYMYGRVSYRTDIKADNGSQETKAVIDAIKEKAVTIAKMGNFVPKETINGLRGIEDLEFLTNFIATTFDTENYLDKIQLLEIDDIHTRAMALLGLLDNHVEMMKIKQDINAKVKSEIDQQQREYYLNNQLKTIQEELGMDECEDFDRFRRMAEEKIWPASVQEIFEKEMAKLERYNPSSPDYSIQYNYIQFMLDLPWGHISEDNLDLRHAQQVLDEDHYGLDKVKDRIIEYLAVLKLKGDMKSPILCLYGPPGVGKTSLGKSIARALGRKYVRIALGGTHDESEIRGHRKTYIGALPGRILNGINRAGTNNPVIVLDEIDKITSDMKGDPSSALLEALDPEQNTAFHDNYLDIDYDLSNVLFLTTANNISTIQPALRDRMEMIDVSGYLAEEKEQIALRHLVPKQLEEHGLKPKQLKLSKDTVRAIIDNYTHESGVRGLEKQIAKIARVTAKKIALEQKHPVNIKPEHLKEYLGLPSAFHDRQKGNEGPGIVTGLAWTEMGGEILFVESSISKGKGALTMTGNLGDVMKESATIAYQWIKAHPEAAGLTYEQFAEKDVHVHVPEGATPKDGPSAGITMVSSMVSAFRGTAIRPGVAMTGEMTLRGKVLPVGGIKEKILAAKRSGVSTIVICEDNRKDVEDIPQIYIEGLEFHYVKTIDDVLAFIFA